MTYRDDKSLSPHDIKLINHNIKFVRGGIIEFVFEVKLNCVADIEREREFANMVARDCMVEIF